MSKLFILALLAALLIPSGAFAASPDSPLRAVNATGGTCILGTGNTAVCAITPAGADGCSCGSGGSCDCRSDCSCGLMEGTKENSGASCCDMMGDDRGPAGATSRGLAGGAVSGCGMMAPGTAIGSCSNGSAIGYGDSCGMRDSDKGSSGTSCGSMMGKGTSGATSCPITGMMGGARGQTTAGGAGSDGWAVLGFILVIILIIIWIIVGILLILNLHRKLSAK